jgi:hypothetical protein
MNRQLESWRHGTREKQNRNQRKAEIKSCILPVHLDPVAHDIEDHETRKHELVVGEKMSEDTQQCCSAKSISDLQYYSAVNTNVWLPK